MNYDYFLFVCRYSPFELCRGTSNPNSAYVGVEYLLTVVPLSQMHYCTKFVSVGQMV